MLTPAPANQTSAKPRHYGPAAGALLAVITFSAVFFLFDSTYCSYASARFPSVGASALLATAWGIDSRAHLLVLIVPLALWRPRMFGFQVGRVWQHGRLLLGMLLANCDVIAAYLLLTRSSTPYSGGWRTRAARS